METYSAPTIISDIEGIVIACNRYRRSILFLLFSAILVSVILALALPVKYRAESSFFPMGLLSGQDNDLSSSLSSVSRRFGINVGGESDPSMLYASLLRSRIFTHRIIPFQYLTSADQKVSLLDVLSPIDKIKENRFENAHKLFVDNYLRTRYNTDSGVTVLSIISKDPVLAAEIANKCVEELNNHILELTASSNTSRAGFIEKRLEIIEQELLSREEKLKNFRIANHDINNSPNLMLIESRLFRDVDIHNQIFLVLKQQHELARIEASKNLARIAVLDNAVPPLIRFSPRRKAIVLFAFLLALIIGITQALVRNHYLSKRKTAQ